MAKTKYTEEIADKICNEIASSSKGLHAICKEIKLHPSTVFDWISKHKEFADKYARAREAQADFLADEIVSISDKPLIGTVTKETKDGTFEETGDNVNRSRLMVDARKWIASKLKPKKYGDKIEAEVNGNLTVNTVIKWGDKEINV